jgi:hypothetical protein
MINPHVPRTFGDACVHYSQLDVVFPFSTPLHVISPKAPSNVEGIIGKIVADRLVKDGATLQLGIGSIPNAVLSHLTNHKDLSIWSEMISDGVENCIQYFRNFDPAKSKNPFAYFTQIIYYAFLRRIMKEKKQLYVKYKATQQFGLLDEGEMFEDENGNMRQFELYDNISEFIFNFEENKKKKKEKKAEGLESFLENDVE